MDRDGAAQNALANLLTWARGSGDGFRGLATNIRTTGTILIGLLIPGMISLLGSLAPVAATVAAAALGLAALGVAAGGAGAALGLLALGAIARFKAQSDIAGTAANTLKTAVGGLKQAFLSATATGADRVFAGLSTLLTGITPQVRGLHGAFTTLGVAMGQALRQNVPATQQLVSSFGQLVTASAPLSGPLVRGLTALGQIMVNIATAAMPFLVSGARAVADQLGRWARSTGDTERLRGVIRGFMADLRQVGGFAREAARALLGLFNTFRGPGRAAAGDLTALAKRVADFTNSAKGQERIREFFQSAFFAIRDLGNFVRTYGPGIAAFFAAFGRAATVLMQALNTLAPQLVTVIGTLGGFAFFAKLLGSALGLLMPLLITLGRVLLFTVIPAIRALGVALITAFATNPVVLAIMAIIAAALLLVLHWDQVKAALGVAWDWLKAKAAEAWAAIKTNIVNPIASAIAWLKQAWTDVKTWISEAWDWIKERAALTWLGVKVKIIDPIRSAINWLKEAWNDAKGWLSGAWDWISSKASTAWGAVKTNVINPVRSAINWLKEAWGNAKESLSNVWERIKNAASDAWDKITSLPGKALAALKGLPGKFYDLGKDLVTGLANGIKDKASAAINAAVDVAEDAWNSAKRFLGIGSPSRLFMEVGRDTVRGYAEGLRREMEMAAGTLTGALALEVSATRAGAASMAAVSPVASGTTVVEHHVNVDVGGVLSPGDPRVQREIGTTVVDALRSTGYVRNARFGAT